MEKTTEEINYLQMLLTLYLEHEDEFIAALIMQINQVLERMKACA
ncbi:MAG: hypothetical protein ACP5G0_09835 [Desulfomonilia bacterium]